jgi:hypothetical protein
MHFCFLDHLHLSTGLKVASPLQSSPYLSLNLQISPQFSSFPFSLLAPLPSPALLPWCLCRRSNAPLWLTAGHLLFSPVHASVPCATTALAPSGWRLVRAPRCPRDASTARRRFCRRRASAVHPPPYLPQTEALLVVPSLLTLPAYKRGAPGLPRARSDLAAAPLAPPSSGHRGARLSALFLPKLTAP